jgi:Ni,Fe-hydrogenase III large subunit
MNAIRALIEAAGVVPCRPWPRYVLTPADWAAMAAALADEPLDLVALWADTAQIHALFAGPLLVSTPHVDGGYAALSPYRPAAAAFERMVRDLWGHAPTGAELDTRPLLDHGAWDMARPMATRPAPSAGAYEPLLRPGAEGLQQLPLGPVRPGITEPVHCRLHAAGEAVRQAEMRLGYAHKGSLVLMRSKSPRAAARFAARIAGDATVAHSIAFARAAEAALGIDAPPRAHVLRAVMAEMERAAVHLDTLAGLCEAAGAGFAAAEFGRHREALLRAAAAAFGHRLMMDCVVPGGVAMDLTPDGAAAILAAALGLAGLDALYAGALADRLCGLGRVAVDRFAPGGVVGRAAGHPSDARVTPGYPPYDQWPVTVPEHTAGDVDARVWVRLAEVAESALLLQRLLAALPAGSIGVALPSISGEGLGVAESARGDVWHWLRLDGGMIATAFAADPGWRLWPLVELALADGALGDVDLITRSFDASASAVDL